MAESRRFTIVSDDFFEPELQSHYTKGLSYTCVPDNTLLAKHLDRWVKEGKAVLGGPAAKMIAVGAVT